MSSIFVKNIFVYPIKSFQGVELKQAKVTAKGFAWDRELMLVNEKGKFLTQRQYPDLAKIKVKILDNFLSLSVQNSDLEPFQFQPSLTGREMKVEVWSDRTIAIDQGDEIADWLQIALNLKANHKYRLVRQSPQYIRVIQEKSTSDQQKSVNFADTYPFLLTTTASLADLNRRIQESYKNKEQTVPMNRFRPNIVVHTDEPFIEDTWKLISLGEVDFDVVKPCSRCIVTTTNQITGERNKLQEPLKTLSSFRQFGKDGIMFGENMIPINTGVVKVGDVLQVIV